MRDAPRRRPGTAAWPRVLVSGIAVTDLIATGLPRVAPPGRVEFASIRPRTGGHACNVSTDLVQLGFPAGRLSAVFPVGDDPFGDYLVAELRGRGVRPAAERIPDVPTSLDMILVVTGEDRRFHVDVGANARLDPAVLLQAVRATRPVLFYLGGAGLLAEVDRSLRSVLEGAREAGAVTFLDIVSPPDGDWDFVRAALPAVDIFHCNEDEARAVTGARVGARTADAIARSGVAAVVVSRGEKGFVASIAGRRYEMSAFDVSVVDPTGAGDAFCAGLILKLARPLARFGSPGRVAPETWKDALLFASACGAACCKGIGATTSVHATHVRTLMRSRRPAA